MLVCYRFFSNFLLLNLINFHNPFYITFNSVSPFFIIKFGDNFFMLLIATNGAVTVTNQAVKALSMLRENKEKFDIVISDVHMPDMDGFKLLELVGLELDLPVISKLNHFYSLLFLMISTLDWH